MDVVNAAHELVHGVLDVVGQLPHFLGPGLDLGARVTHRRELVEEGVHALELRPEEEDVGPRACHELVLGLEDGVELRDQGGHGATRQGCTLHVQKDEEGTGCKVVVWLVC